jgi:pyridoxine 5-phosphate synthase
MLVGARLPQCRAIAALPGVRELNIGHAIIARAIFSGLDLAVRDMKRIMTAAARAGRG